MVDKSLFYNGTNQLQYKVCFAEYDDALKLKAVYTLKDDEWLTPSGKTFPSLYKCYMEFEDETEWEFANKYLANWEHWETLCNTGWFKPYVTRWRKELELKLRARALKNVKDMAQEGGREGFQANKYLLDKTYLNDSPKKRGRPSKAEIAEKADSMVSEEMNIQETYKRLGLNS